MLSPDSIYQRKRIIDAGLYLCQYQGAKVLMQKLLPQLVQKYLCTGHRFLLLSCPSFHILLLKQTGHINPFVLRTQSSSLIVTASLSCLIIPHNPRLINKSSIVVDIFACLVQAKVGRCSWGIYYLLFSVL